MTYNIPNESIINVDQTLSKYPPTETVTLAEENSKHVARKGDNDETRMTVTRAESISGEVLLNHIQRENKYIVL